MEFRDRFDDVAVRLRQFDSSAPVLLRPSSELRSYVFEKIIKLYLQLGRDPCPDPTAQAVHDWVLCADPGANLLCKAYAESQGRPYQVWIYGQELPSSARSVTFVGLTNNFPPIVRETLSEQIRHPWGIICDVDLAGLAFQLVKMLLVPYLPYGGTLDLNALTRLISHRDAGSICSTMPFSGSRVKEELANSSVSLALLQMHGRGSHAVSEDLAFCGAIGDVEVDRWGRAIPNGCRGNFDGDHYCKMAKPHHTVVRFSSFLSPIVGLFTCASAAFPTELFPSNSSAVLSTLQGFPAHVIAANQVWTARRFESVPIFDLILNGMSLGEVVQQLNDEQCRYRDHRPFILFGDPTARAPQQWIEVAQRPINRNSDTDSRGGNSVSNLDGGGFEAWQTYHLRFLEVARRAIHWDWLLISVTKQYQAMLTADPTFRTRLDKLQYLRIAILSEVQNGLTLTTAIKRARTWEPVLPACWELVGLAPIFDTTS